MVPILLSCAIPTLFLESRRSFLAVLSCLLLLWGNLALQRTFSPDQTRHELLDRYAGTELTIEGIVSRRPELREQGGRLLVKVERMFAGQQPLQYTGLVLLQVKEGSVAVLTGDRVRFRGRLSEPRLYGLPGEFDYRRYLAARGITATAFVKDASGVVLVYAGAALPLQRWVDGIALAIGRAIGVQVPGAAGGVLRALVIGDTGFIPAALKDAYSRAGVNHILSISGFHVGIVALFLYQLFGAVARLRPALLLRINLRRVVVSLSLPAVLFYLFLSGAAPATLRSVLMLGLMAAALFLERETDPVNALAVAAMALLLGNPATFYDLSFQFSFLALWGIIVLVPLFCQPCAALENRWLRNFLLLIAASAAAILATLMPVAFYFHRATLTGLLANLVAVPLLGYGAVIVGLAAVPFVFTMPAAAAPLLTVAGWLVALADDLLLWMARLPQLPPFRASTWDVLATVVLLAGLTVARSRRGRWCWLVLALTLFAGGRLTLPTLPEGQLRFTFFSVGQGESTLVSFPDGATMLIDGGGSVSGGSWDVGERLLVPALWAMGVDRLDYLVLSHPHPDHLLGLLAVARHFPVGQFWEGASDGGGEDYQALHRLLAASQVPRRRLDCSSRPVVIDGVTVRVLHPASSGAATFDGDANEESLVLSMEQGPFRALFTGDIGFAAEEQLLKQPVQLASTLLKVPHHGSRYAALPEFLRRVSPGLAVISAGYRNSFHLPAQETIDQLQQLGSRIYRTDRDGTITVTWPGEHGRPSVTTTSGHFH
jgi:competence protein ComEC